MGHAADSKLVLWRDRLRRHAQSGLSVAAFCAREGVSTPSFYAWRRRLKAAKSTAAKREPTAKAPAFQAVTVVGAMPVLSVRLPGGTQFEVCVADPQVIRTVVAQLLQASRGDQAGGAAC